MILGLRLPPTTTQWTVTSMDRCLYNTVSEFPALHVSGVKGVANSFFFPSFLLTATDWSHHRPLPRGDVHVTDLTLLEVPTWLAATASSKYRKTRCYSRVSCPPSSCCVEIVTWFIRDSQGGLRRACVPPSLCFIHREPQIFLNCTYRHFQSLTFIFT